MTKLADNVNPNVYEKRSEREQTTLDLDENVKDCIDEREVFDLIRNINDPEHPLTLEELRVVEEANIKVDDQKNTVDVHFTPTIPHCSMATLIGELFWKDFPNKAFCNQVTWSQPRRSSQSLS